MKNHFAAKIRVTSLTAIRIHSEKKTLNLKKAPASLLIKNILINQLFYNLKRKLRKNLKISFYFNLFARFAMLSCL